MEPEDYDPERTWETSFKVEEDGRRVAKRAKSKEKAVHWGRLALFLLPIIGVIVWRADIRPMWRDMKEGRTFWCALNARAYVSWYSRETQYRGNTITDRWCQQSLSDRSAK